MRKYCGSVTCPTTSKGVETDYEILGVVVPEGLTAKHYQLKCTICGYETLERVPDRCKPQRYPYYNASTDQFFQDKSHEKKYVKEKGLEGVTRKVGH